MNFSCLHCAASFWVTALMDAHLRLQTHAKSVRLWTAGIATCAEDDILKNTKANTQSITAKKKSEETSKNRKRTPLVGTKGKFQEKQEKS